MMMMMMMNAETVKKVQNDPRGLFNLRKWDYFEVTRGRGVFIRVYLVFLSQLCTILVCSEGEGSHVPNDKTFDSYRL